MTPQTTTSSQISNEIISSRYENYIKFINRGD